MEHEDLAEDQQTADQAQPAEPPPPEPVVAEAVPAAPQAPEPAAAQQITAPAPEAPAGLSLESIKPGELLKNLKDDNIYKVTGVSGKKVLVRDFLASERIFLFVGQFERPSDSEAREFERARVKPAEPKISTVKPELAKKESDALADYLERVRQAPGSDAEKFGAFWKQALEIFGDDPTLTWRMRTNKGLQPSPTLRLRSSKTNRWRDAIMLWAMEKLTIIVSKEVCPETDREACRGVFPDDNEAYGKAISVTIPYRDLDEAKAKTYLDCFRMILKAFSA